MEVRGHANPKLTQQGQGDAARSRMLKGCTCDCGDCEGDDSMIRAAAGAGGCDPLENGLVPVLPVLQAKLGLTAAKMARLCWMTCGGRSPRNRSRPGMPV